MDYASSLDVIGIFGSTVADASSCYFRGVKVGLIRETLEDGVDSATQEAASHLEALGLCIDRGLTPFLLSWTTSLTMALPHLNQLQTYYAMMVSGKHGFSREVRTLIQKDFKAALYQTDILISPAAPSAAYKIGEKSDDPLAMYAGDI
ncbi:hypothetical protein Bca4012_059852 [Brassica carinata]